MKHFFIINPSAGKVHEGNCRAGIEKVCKERDLVYEIGKTSGRGSILKLVKDAVSRGFDVIYPIGGDGTINEAANALLRHIESTGNPENVMLAPVAAGTGNDFVRSLDNSSVYANFTKRVKKSDAVAFKKNKFTGNEWAEYIGAVIDGKECKVDCAKANDKFFINIASLGIDACVVKNAVAFKKSKLCPDKFAYTASVVKTFVKYKPFVFEISIDGGEAVTGEYTLAAVANGKYYGGGIMPVPSASLKNGRLDVCIAKKVKKIQVIDFFPKYAKGKHTNLPIAQFAECKEITIKSPETIALNVDGELYDVDSVVFKVQDFKLPIKEL